MAVLDVGDQGQHDPGDVPPEDQVATVEPANVAV